MTKKKIRSPLWLSVSVLLLCGVFLQIVLAYYLEKKNTEEHVEESSLQNANVLFNHIQDTIEFLYAKGEQRQIRLKIADLATDPYTRLAVLIDDKDKIIYSMNMVDEGSSFNELLAKKLPAYKKNINQNIRSNLERFSGDSYFSFDRNYLFSIYPVVLGLKEGAITADRTGFVISAKHLKPIKEAQISHIFSNQYQFFLTVAVMMLIMGVGLHYLLTRRLMKITHAANMVREGDYRARIITKGSDEISYLARTFNNMASSIEQSIKDDRLKNAQINELNEILSSIIDNLPIMLFLKDAKTLEYVNWNRAAEQVIGYSKEEMLGKSDYDFWKPEEAEFFVEVDRKVIESGELKEIPQEPVSTRYQGERILRTKKIPVYDRKGQPIYLLGISEDITDTLKAEQELCEYRDHLEELVKERTANLELAYKDLEIARDEAIRATNIKSEFLANMSHELRTPLNSILGFTGVVKEGIAGDLNEEQKKQLNIAYESAEHLLMLINDILDISKIEAGKIELTKEEFDCIALINEVVNSLKPLGKQKNLQLQIDIEPDVLLICSDKGKLKQVLINLISNAYKFTQQGMVRITCRSTEKEVFIEVEDTGEGIEKKNFEKIFEPFKQVDGSNVRVHQGTGLGLAISRKFIKIMGGTISVDSTVGKGTRFTVCLPL